jgi:hypothetical protein
MLVLPSHGTREDEMHPSIDGEIAAQRFAELHQQPGEPPGRGRLRGADPAAS